MAQKRDFFNESASSSARDARQYLTDSAFASLVISPPARVCPMPIGPAVAELSSRDGTHVCPILTFLTISSCIFPMLKQRGNRRFSSACHAFIFYPNDPVSRRRSSSIRSLQNVQISAGYRQRFGLGMTPKDLRNPKVKHTFRQTDAPYSNSIVDK